VRPEDVTYALDRFIDLCTVVAGSGHDVDDALGIAQRVYEGAGYSEETLTTLAMGLHYIGQHDLVALLDLTDPITIGAVGFGSLLGAVAMEHATERKVAQLVAALELIAEDEASDEMFGAPSARRIAKVALAEVMDGA
jgi:hypothetical protein